MFDQPEIHLVVRGCFSGMPSAAHVGHLAEVLVAVNAGDALRAAEQYRLSGHVVPFGWEPPPNGAACKAHNCTLVLFEAAAKFQDLSAEGARLTEEKIIDLGGAWDAVQHGDDQRDVERLNYLPFLWEPFDEHVAQRSARLNGLGNLVVAILIFHKVGWRAVFLVRRAVFLLAVQAERRIGYDE